MTTQQTAIRHALEALTEWGCTHTGPNDPNSPHELLIAARAALDGPSAPISSEREPLTVERLRAALSGLREFEARQTRRMNDENGPNGPQPPNGDDWNDLSEEVRSACSILPEQVYIVEGNTTKDPGQPVFRDDGKFPPFAIFDVEADEHVDLPKRYVHFLSREAAEDAVMKLRDDVAVEDLTDPLRAIPEGYRPLGAHEPIRPGVLAMSQTDEQDEDNEGLTRVTPAGSVGIIDSHNGGDTWNLHFYSTGAAICPDESELRDPTQFHLYVRG